MSNRKENLKKSLGITEYPWSSDEEDSAAAQPQVDPRLRQPVTTMENVSNMPGTSAGQSGQSSVLINPPPTPARSIDEVRRERDSFWSYINNTQRPASKLPIRRRDAVTFPDLRQPEVPPARDRDRLRPSTDIGRILSFHKFARSINSTRPGRSPCNLYQQVVPAGNGGPSRSRLFTPTASDVTGSIHPRPSGVLFRITRTRTYPGHRRNGTANPQTNETAAEDNSQPTTSGSIYTGLYHSNTENASTPANPPTANLSGELNTIYSDDEPMEENATGTQFETPRIWNPINVSQNLDTEQNTSNEDSHEVSNPNASTSVLALEEEIVELDTADETEPNTNENGDADVEVIETPQNNENAEISAVRPSGSASAPVQGVKRKRESSGDNGELYTVKEFNQVLLRLLECPVCLEWMEPPMAQCRRGHLVCGGCRARLSACPVCRSMFSSVRNRAMEGVAEVLRYPCRHGCGREVRLRKRAPHEASCGARLYQCPLPACATHKLLPHHQLATHFQSNHQSILKFGNKHKFSMKVNVGQHEHWIIMALDEFFHLRVDVDIRTWGIVLYVAYIGPKKKSSNFTYKVSVEGQHHSRKLVYTRATHSDLESLYVNVNRQDCFHITLDQALNFLRIKNRHCEPDKYLDLTLEINQCDSQAVPVKEESDS